ncbi:two-component sensor histidine kinase [Sulfurovum sp. NBC37-1]|nr:two-component sensor histidine kinase [Sulfurovum sp. NBC37-1]
MSKVEINSFMRSIVLFFVSLSILIILLYNHIYRDKVQTHQYTLYSQMQIASLTLHSSIFTINFVEKSKDKQLYKLLRNKKSLYAYFEIFNSKKYFTKVSYPLENFRNDIAIIERGIAHEIIQALFLAFIVSVLFSFYALYPLKQSLKMTNEFIKDILHDFNTPISTIRLNLRLLPESNPKIKQRIASAVDTILNLQKNLKEFINEDMGEREAFDIKSLIEQRVAFFSGSYPHIYFNLDMESKNIYTYKNAMIRIIDNLLSNACKYSNNEGNVSVSLDQNILSIKDNGIGIKNPKKIFDRFYKETSRGLGIGLHIVDKLAKKMDIKIEVRSKINKGSVFKLDLSAIMNQSQQTRQANS